MFCPKCGSQLPDEARFCDACGARIADFLVGEPSAEPGPEAESAPPEARDVPEAPGAEEPLAPEAHPDPEAAEGLDEPTGVVGTPEAADLEPELPEPEETSVLAREAAQEADPQSGLDVMPQEDLTSFMPAPAEPAPAPRRRMSAGQVVALCLGCVAVFCAVAFGAWKLFSARDVSAREAVEDYVRDSGVLVYDTPASELAEELGVDDGGVPFEVDSVEVVDSSEHELPPELRGTYEGDTYTTYVVEIVLSNGSTEISGTTELDYYETPDGPVTPDAPSLDDPVFLAVDQVPDEVVLDHLAEGLAAADAPSGAEWTIESHDFDADEQLDVVVLTAPAPDGSGDELTLTLTFSFVASDGTWILTVASLDGDVFQAEEAEDATGLLRLADLLALEPEEISDRLADEGLAPEALEPAEGEDVEAEGSAADAEPEAGYAWYADQAPEGLVEELRAMGVEPGDGTGGTYAVTVQLGVGLPASDRDDASGATRLSADDLADGEAPDSVVVTMNWDTIAPIDVEDGEACERVAEALFPDGELVETFRATDGPLMGQALVGTVELDGETYLWSVDQFCFDDDEAGGWSNVRLRVALVPIEVARLTCDTAQLYEADELDEAFEEPDEAGVCERFARSIVQIDISYDDGTPRLNVLTGERETLDASGEWVPEEPAEAEGTEEGSEAEAA